MLEKVHLIYSTDMGYMRPVLVSAASAVVHAKEHPLVIHMVVDRVTDDAFADFENRLKAVPSKVPVEIVRHDWTDTRFDAFPKWHGSSLVYARLVFHEMIHDVDWAIAQDGDTLWFGDPWEMLKCRDEDMLFQMSIDPPDPRGLQNPCLEWYKERGMEVKPENYFCAGVMLMNLKGIREQKFLDEALDFLKRFPDPPYCEQMVICERAQGRTKALPREWGIYSYHHCTIDVKTTPCLVHYVQDLPWKRVKPVHLMSDICLAWHRFARETLGFETLKEIPLAQRLWRRGVYLIFKYNQWLLKVMPCRLKVLLANTKGL